LVALFYWSAMWDRLMSGSWFASGAINSTVTCCWSRTTVRIPQPRRLGLNGFSRFLRLSRRVSTIILGIRIKLCLSVWPAPRYACLTLPRRAQSALLGRARAVLLSRAHVILCGAFGNTMRDHRAHSTFSQGPRCEGCTRGYNVSNSKGDLC